MEKNAHSKKAQKVKAEVSTSVLTQCPVAVSAYSVPSILYGFGVNTFLKTCKHVRSRTPLLWESSKRNRRVEVYYWLDHGMPKTTLLT